MAINLKKSCFTSFARYDAMRKHTDYTDADKDAFLKKYEEYFDSSSMGELIAKLRSDEFKMNQIDFATLMGISAGTLRNWEQGLSEPPTYFMHYLFLTAIEYYVCNKIEEAKENNEKQSGHCIDLSNTVNHRLAELVYDWILHRAGEYRLSCPARHFADAAKRGEFNNLTEYEYELLRHRCRLASKPWNNEGTCTIRHLMENAVSFMDKDSAVDFIQSIIESGEYKPDKTEDVFKTMTVHSMLQTHWEANCDSEDDIRERMNMVYPLFDKYTNLGAGLFPVSDEREDLNKIYDK